MGSPLQPKANPLGEADLAKINQALAHVESGLAQAELASRAGLNVDQQIAQLKDTQAKLTQLKQTYFPGV